MHVIKKRQLGQRTQLSTSAMTQFRCSNCFGKIPPHVVAQLQDGAVCLCITCDRPIDRYTKYNPQTHDYEEMMGMTEHADNSFSEESEVMQASTFLERLVCERLQEGERRQATGLPSLQDSFRELLNALLDEDPSKPLDDSPFRQGTEGADKFESTPMNVGLKLIKTAVDWDTAKQYHFALQTYKEAIGALLVALPRELRSFFAL